jgi:hypothetical protein
MDVLTDDTGQNLDELRQAANLVKAYSDNATPLLPVSDQELAIIVNNEVAQRSIILDKDGLISGIRNILYVRIQQYMQDFSSVKQSFNAKFQPFQSQIEDFENIPGRIATLTAEAESKIAEEKQKLDANRVGEDYRNTKARYDSQVERHPYRPNMKAVSARFPFDVNPIYLIIMLLLGTAEWFINYDTLFEFFGIPIIAIGATLILALGLAVIAHQHGVDLKQWKKKFGPGVEGHNRPYGVLILATFGLVGLITVTGWMRYQSLMSVIQSQSTANIIGTQYSVQIDPEREVIISLGANALAWLVGVFISYFAHDADPTYVHTAIDFLKAERKYKSKRAEFEKIANQIKHQYAEKIEEEKNRLQKFETSSTLRDAINLRNQTGQYEEGFRDRSKTFFISQYGRFRSELLRVLQNHPEVSLFKNEKGTAVPISINDYQTLAFSISEDNFLPLSPRG